MRFPADNDQFVTPPIRAAFFCAPAAGFPGRRPKRGPQNCFFAFNSF